MGSHRKSLSGLKNEFIPSERRDSSIFDQTIDRSRYRSGEWEEKVRMVQKKRERERDMKAEEKELVRKNREKPPLRLLSLGDCPITIS